MLLKKMTDIFYIIITFDFLASFSRMKGARQWAQLQ